MNVIFVIWLYIWTLPCEMIHVHYLQMHTSAEVFFVSSFIKFEMDCSRKKKITEYWKAYTVQ